MEQYLHSFVQNPHVLSEVWSFLSEFQQAPAFPEQPAQISEPLSLAFQRTGSSDLLRYDNPSRHFVILQWTFPVYSSITPTVTTYR